LLVTDDQFIGQSHNQPPARRLRLIVQQHGYPRLMAENDVPVATRGKARVDELSADA